MSIFIRPSSLLMLVFFACGTYGEPSAQAGEKTTGLQVSGRVADADGKGIAGVAVTDGFDMALTDGDGRYTIGFNAEKSRFVYISVPAAYEVPLHKQGHPLFFNPLTPKGKGNTDFVLVKRKQPLDRYTLIVLGDIQIVDRTIDDRIIDLRQKIVPDVIDFIRSADGPVIALSVGDLVGNDMSLFGEYRSQMERLGIPVFNLIGNHDHDPASTDDMLAARPYEDHFGPANYSFDLGDIHYVILDNVIHRSKQEFERGFTDDVIAWLRKDLSHVAKGRTLIVGMHVPLDSNESQNSAGKVRNYDTLLELLAGYKVHMIAGHRHTSDMYNYPAPYDNMVMHVCPRTGGFHKIPGDYCTDGTPSGYTVFGIGGTEMTWYHKSVGTPAPGPQMTVFSPTEIGNNRVFANVWYWDSQWGPVEWWENGRKIADMQHYPRVDPNFDREFRAAKKGKEYTEKSWHMFRVTPSAGVTSGVVKVTDRFGNRHEQPISW